jgi:hypothetical protein
MPEKPYCFFRKGGRLDMKSDAGALYSKSTMQVWRQKNDISTMTEFQIKHLTQNLIGC